MHTDGKQVHLALQYLSVNPKWHATWRAKLARYALVACFCTFNFAQMLMEQTTTSKPKNMSPLTTDTLLGDTPLRYILQKKKSSERKRTGFQPS